MDWDQLDLVDMVVILMELVLPCIMDYLKFYLLLPPLLKRLSETTQNPKERLTTPKVHFSHHLLEFKYAPPL